MLCAHLVVFLAAAASVSAFTVTKLRPKSRSYNNFVYLIRHGEKPADGSNGLSPRGEERAQCLAKNVFGAQSAFNIGYIMAQTPKASGKRVRPLQSVTPLAASLQLTVDISCDRDDPDCVAVAVAAFAATSDKNILICWEHDALTDIVEALGVRKEDAPTYPGHSFDLIWTLQHEKILDDTRSENCPGLDN